MSISDIVALEDLNQGFIILHAEGIFWRAYEKSAYVFATQVAPMQILKKGYKVLGGREVCYLGFPMATAEKYLTSLTLEGSTEKQRKYRAPHDWDEADYEKWHQEIAPHQVKTTSELPANPHEDVLDAIRGFEVLTHTPLDALHLIVSLQQMLKS